MRPNNNPPLEVQTFRDICFALWSFSALWLQIFGYMVLFYRLLVPAPQIIALVHFAHIILQRRCCYSYGLHALLMSKYLSF